MGVPPNHLFLDGIFLIDHSVLCTPIPENPHIRWFKTLRYHPSVPAAVTTRSLPPILMWQGSPFDLLDLTMVNHQTSTGVVYHGNQKQCYPSCFVFQFYYTLPLSTEKNKTMEQKPPWNLWRRTPRAWLGDGLFASVEDLGKSGGAEGLR